MSLAGKTLFITGASRGIGLAIALRAARDGANIAIAAKTTAPHPKLEGTIFSAAAEIERAGGKALPLAVDIRDEAAVKAAIARTADVFGGIDIVVNNASAVSISDTPSTEMKRFDLMQQVNTRGTFLVTKEALPFLEKAANPHVLMLSPPLDMSERWFAPHVAYSIAKYGMSFAFWASPASSARADRRQCALAAHDDRHRRDQEPPRRRSGDARLADTGDPRRRGVPDLPETRARFHRQFSDRRLLPRSAEGITDLDRYRVDPSMALQPDFFVPADSVAPVWLGPATR